MNGHSVKECNGCHEVKSLSEFNKHRSFKDGLSPSCRKCHKKHNALWRKRNRLRCIKRTKEWQINNRDKVNENRREYSSKRYNNDINFKLSCTLRTRINSAISRGYKAGSAISDLGCSIEYFKKYIESQFLDGMSWKNYGSGDGRWNLDHIKPLSRFDLVDRKQFLKACHYSNMQPMWSMDNSKKGVN